MNSTHLKRSKSDGDIPKRFHRRGSGVSESSEVFLVDSASEWGEGKQDVFGVLEGKMDRLSDLFVEQCRLMTEIKEELRESKAAAKEYEQVQSQLLTELLKTALTESNNNTEPAPLEQFNGRARRLLSAIESKHAFTLDQELRSMLVDLLQSEELKDQIVSATVNSLRDVVARDMSRNVAQLYTPVLRRANRRLAAQLTRTLDDGFAELEAQSAQMSSAVCRVTRCLRRALDRHRALLESQADPLEYLRASVDQILHQELTSWREIALETWSSEAAHAQWAERGASPPPLDYPHSPPQPANPQDSIIDQLMKTAIINKQIADGDVNAAFSHALSAADLSLVMAACRAAPVHRVFAPCRLEQTVLLSLAQQLPTDMVHETQLKCRILHQELTSWREIALETWSSEAAHAQWAERGASPPPLDYPHSPPQPANPQDSIIDQLMKTAIINKQIADGDVNAAFSHALTAADLSLVMAACRAAPVHRVFAPCRLEQTVLLSLAQQLPTDMVHETQLKCRYLEEVLLNLDPAHPATRAHLPLVVAEIRRHLTNFLTKFPGHVASKRITLITMAANNLIK